MDCSQRSLILLLFACSVFPSLGASVEGRREVHCNGIYRGFSECLLRLGDSMSRYVEEELVEEQDIDNVCAHWDEFHACGMAVISECRVEVQAVWDSLRLQSENLRFHGNLYEVCRAREQSSQHRLTGSSATRVQTKTGCIALALVIGGTLIVRAEL